MNDSAPSRRQFLFSSSALAGSAWLAFSLPAIRAAGEHARKAMLSGGAAFDVLSADEARELEAIAAQIFPTDDSPGAREAGVIYFIDRALGSFAADETDAIRRGLHELQTTVAEKFPGAEGFSSLGNEQQAELLEEIEATPFFGTVRFLTVAGMFADPSYGGNRDKIGWKLLGFEDRFAHQPPFGYYDSEYETQGQ